MDTSIFDFHIPEELIAQYPLEKREEARLMVVDRKRKSLEHRFFKDIVEYLKEGDLIVFNNTRVIPARLRLEKITGGKVEILLTEKMENGRWKAIGTRLKRIREGMSLYYMGEEVLKVEKKMDNGELVVSIDDEKVKKIGEIPLPPYIKRAPEKIDEAFYQTVYAKINGSSAAPTAGLHFTKELINSLKKKGVNIAFITLHIGLGTFRPIKVDRIEDHKMHREYFSVSEEAADMINATKKKGGRVVAVGTTVVRALESVAGDSGDVKPYSGYTELYIYPPYRFKVVDSLITNFHFPRSTLIVLVSAFAGLELIKKAYEEAVRKKYRFYSYGDAMLII